MARSENSKRTSDNRQNRERGNRGGPRDFDQSYQGGGQEFDYSAGNLKYGTGKYTQRENDGYQGGVNLSRDGRSMQDSVYREDRENVDRTRGRPRPGMRDYDNDPEGGMRNYNGGRTFRDRMGGRAMLRDMQQGDGGYGDFDDDFGYGRGRGVMDPSYRSGRGSGYGSNQNGGKVMGGSSKSRGGGYRSRQFEAGLSNERRRYEEYGFRMDDYLQDDRVSDYETGSSTRRRNLGRGPGGGRSNFDRKMGRGADGYRMDHDDYMYDDYYEDEYYRGGRNSRRGGRRNMDDDYYDQYGRGGNRRRRSGNRNGGDYYDEDYGRGDGRLLRDHRR